MAVNENAFVHGSSGNALYGGRPNISDWTVTAGTAGSGTAGAALPSRVPDDGTGLDGSPEDVEAPQVGSMPLEVDVAPAGRLPFQEASLQVRCLRAVGGGGLIGGRMPVFRHQEAEKLAVALLQPSASLTPASHPTTAARQVASAADPARGAASGSEEGAPIGTLDLGTLEAYVGVAGATVFKPAVSTPTAAAAGAAAAVLGAAAGASSGLSRLDTGLSDVSNPLEPAPLPAAGAGYESEGEGGAAGRDVTAAQAAARAEFRRDTAGVGWHLGAGQVSPAGWQANSLPWCMGVPALHNQWHSVAYKPRRNTPLQTSVPPPPCLTRPKRPSPPADDEDDFFSSDEESAPTEADSRWGA